MCTASEVSGGSRKNVHSAINNDSLTAASSGKDASGEASLHAAVTNDV
jgi:hypothetical protein